MRTIAFKDVEPVEVLEKVVLHFPHFSDEMSIEERPVVNVYRYRFDDDFGVELSLLDKLSSGHVRFLLYQKDSNTIKSATQPAHAHRPIMRHIIKICLSTKTKHKDTVRKWRSGEEFLGKFYPVS
jgi:hypothetical protein